MDKRVLVLILAASFSGMLNAKNIEYYDNSCKVASPELINLVESVAREVD